MQIGITVFVREGPAEIEEPKWPTKAKGYDSTAFMQCDQGFHSQKQNMLEVLVMITAEEGNFCTGHILLFSFS